MTVKEQLRFRISQESREGVRASASLQVKAAEGYRCRRFTSDYRVLKPIDIAPVKLEFRPFLKIRSCTT